MFRAHLNLYLYLGAPSSTDYYPTLAKTVAELLATVTRLDADNSANNALNQKVYSLETLLTTHEAQFAASHPLLRSVKDLQAKITSLEQKSIAWPALQIPQDPWLNNFAMHITPNAIPAAPVTPDSASFSQPLDVGARLCTLEHQLKSLEKRVVGNGIRIGRFLFQSREDLWIWLLANVPSNCFGLFLDGVSIFDFLAQTHMDSQENMAHLYNSQKNGFDTIYESRIISFMQNWFPNLFGKSGSDGMDTSKTLLGLQSSDKWNLEGVTGLQLQVERELPNVNLQFRNAIATTFEDSPEARDLSLELLYR